MTVCYAKHPEIGTPLPVAAAATNAGNAPTSEEREWVAQIAAGMEEGARAALLQLLTDSFQVFDNLESFHTPGTCATTGVCRALSLLRAARINRLRALMTELRQE